MSIPVRHTAAAMVAAAALALSQGCRAPAEASEPSPQAPGAGPSLLDSMQRGMEVYRLLNRPYRHKEKLEDVLAPYSAEPLGLSAEQLDRLRSEGLIVVAIPVELLADRKKSSEFLVALTGEPIVERIHLGFVPEWKAVVTAPRLDSPRLVRVGGEIGEFTDGRFRMLMRDYPLIDSKAPMLRLEAVVQFHQPRRDPLSPDPVREARMGVYVPTSALRVDLDGKWAVLVTAIAPVGVAAGPPSTKPAESEAEAPPAEAEPEAEQDKPAGEQGAGLVPVGAQPQPAGPASPRIRTAGEEALVSPDGDTRFVLIFVPHVK